MTKDWHKKSRKKISLGFDWKFFLLILGLTFFGVMMVYNASVVEANRVFSDQYYYLKNQALWAIAGVLIMLVLSQIDYHLFQKIAPWLFVVNLILLILVLIPKIGFQIKGARRWLDLGFFMLQPSELIKLTFTIYLSSWLGKKRYFWQFLFLIFLVSGLIIFQPDFGTMAVVISNAFVIYFLVGINLLNLIPTIGLTLASGIYFILNSDYRRQRLLTYLNPGSDPLGSSYHIRQALIALGAGGFFGLGLGHSRQKYAYLPEATTDSIFAIIAEEIGFIGCFLLIGLFFLLIYRGLSISRRAPDQFGQLLGAGISSWIAIQILINLAAMVALIPLTGLPLPLISYGGSSLIVTLAGLGILLNIAKHR